MRIHHTGREPRLPQLIHLGGDAEVPAINQRESVYLSAVLRAVRGAEHDEGIVLVTGSTARRADRLLSCGEPLPVIEPFIPVAAAEVYEIEVSAREVERRGIRLLNPDRLCPRILHDDSAGQDVLLLIDRIEQTHQSAAAAVPKPELETLRTALLSLCPKGIRRGQPAGQPVFPGIAPRLLEAEVAAAGAVCRPEPEAAVPVISIAKGRKLLRQRVRGIAPVVSGIIGIPGEAPIPERQKRKEASLRPSSIVEMEQMPVGADPHLICAVQGMQRQKSLLPVINDCHFPLPFC